MADDDAPRGIRNVGARGQACNTCAHLYPDHSFCEAFPDGAGIPVVILNGLNNHTEPFPGDRGIRYEYAPILGPRPPWA
jgi:hypothetical protein